MNEDDGVISVESIVKALLSIGLVIYQSKHFAISTIIHGQSENLYY